MRAYTFTNYAGRFLYVEAHDKNHTTPPARRCRWPTRARTACRRSSTSATARSARTAVTPRPAATSSRQRRRPVHVPPRPDRPLRGADANLAANDITVRVASRPAQLRHQRRHRVGRQGAAAARDGVPEGLHHASTWTRPRSTAGSTRSPRSTRTSSRSSTCREDRRLPAPAMAMMAGTTAANGTPNAARRRRPCSWSRRPRATSAATTSPPSSRPRGRHADSPLSITVTDGTWRDHDPARHGPQRRHLRDHARDQGHRRQPRHRRRPAR